MISVNGIELDTTDQQWLIDLKEAPDLIVPKILETLKNRDEVIDCLHNRNNEINRYYEDNITSLEKMLSK